MTVEDIINNIEIQTVVHVVYYDGDNYERVEVDYFQDKKVKTAEIRFMYVDDGELYFGISKEDIK